MCRVGAAGEQRDEEALVGLAISPGYRGARLGTPEIVVRLAVRSGLDQLQLSELLQRLQASWQADPLIVDRVDSMSVSVVPA